MAAGCPRGEKLAVAFMSQTTPEPGAYPTEEQVCSQVYDLILEVCHGELNS